MTRFQYTPYEIRDSKNPKSSIGETKILQAEYSSEALEQSFENILSDIEVLLRNHIKLNRDNFNLAVFDGKAHLFFNDLGTAKFENILPERLENYIDGYVSYCLQTFINCITEEEYNTTEGKYDYNSLKNNLKRKLLKKFEPI